MRILLPSEYHFRGNYASARRANRGWAQRKKYLTPYLIIRDFPICRRLAETEIRHERKFMMENLLWILVVEDILFLVVISIFLYLKERTYVILAAIFAVELLIVNVIYLKFYQNWFIIGLPFFSFMILVVLGRPFLPKPRVTMGVRTTRIGLFITLFVLLALTILFVIAIIFFRK